MNAALVSEGWENAGAEGKTRQSCIFFFFKVPFSTNQDQASWNGRAKRGPKRCRFFMCIQSSKFSINKSFPTVFSSLGFQLPSPFGTALVLPRKGKPPPLFLGQAASVLRWDTCCKAGSFSHLPSLMQQSLSFGGVRPLQRAMVSAEPAKGRPCPQRLWFGALHCEQRLPCLPFEHYSSDLRSPPVTWSSVGNNHEFGG